MRWLLLIGFFATAHASTMVGNGGGAGELALVYAQQNYTTLVEPCLRTDACDLNAAELSTLEAIENLSTLPLKFLSSQDMGEAPYAIGSNEIQINKDKLWTSSGDAYSVADGLQLLTEAQAERSQQKTGELAGKIAAFLRDKRTVLIVDGSNPNMRVSIFKDYVSDMMVMDDGFDRFLRLDDLIAAQIDCKVDRLLLFTFQWQPTIAANDTLLLTGRAGWTCTGDSSKHTGDVTVIFPVEPREGTERRQIPAQKLPDVIVSGRHR